MTHETDYTLLNKVIQMLSKNDEHKFARVIETVINEAMKVERCQRIQAEPYERNENRKGHANGFKDKTITLASGKIMLKIPQVRGMEFYPSCIEKGIRSERALKLAIAEMYVKGVSTRKVSEITEILCGANVSSSQVSRLNKELDEEIDLWRNRSLGKMQYLCVDATYQSVREGNQVVKQALLVAIGVDYEGKRHVLGVDVANNEAEVNWRNFLEGLISHKLYGLQMIVSDAHTGLRAALDAVFPGVLWQRCQFHLQQNAQGYITKKADAKQIASDIRAVFNAPDGDNAIRYLDQLVEKYQDSNPKFTEWADENLREGFAVFNLPKSHRIRMRTSNLAERQMKEIKRRTNVVGIFPNSKSLIRLTGSLLIELGEHWQYEQRYLSEVSDQPASG